MPWNPSQPWPCDGPRAFQVGGLKSICCPSLRKGSGPALRQRIETRVLPLIYSCSPCPPCCEILPSQLYKLCDVNITVLTIAFPTTLTLQEKCLAIRAIFAAIDLIVSRYCTGQTQRVMLRREPFQNLGRWPKLKHDRPTSQTTSPTHLPITIRPLEEVLEALAMSGQCAGQCDSGLYHSRNPAKKMALVRPCTPLFCHLGLCGSKGSWGEVRVWWWWWWSLMPKRMDEVPGMPLFTWCAKRDADAPGSADDYDRWWWWRLCWQRWCCSC